MIENVLQENVWEHCHNLLVHSIFGVKPQLHQVQSLIPHITGIYSKI